MELTNHTSIPKLISNDSICCLACTTIKYYDKELPR